MLVEKTLINKKSFYIQQSLATVTQDLFPIDENV